MDLIDIEKMTKAKRLHRRYKLANANGFVSKLAHEMIEPDVIELEAILVDDFIDEVSEFRKKQVIDLSLKARNKNVFATDELEYAQGSKEWLRGRMGLITASNTCFTTKGLPIPSFDEYVNKKVADAFIKNNDGEVEEKFTSEAMQAGTDLEIYAREDYEALTGRKIDSHGFIVAKDMMIGMSPDGVVELDSGDRVNIEIKSVLLNTYIGELYDRKVSKQYNIQMQVQMMLLDCDHTDLLIQCQQVSGKPLQLIVRHIMRDELVIENMIDTIKKFEVAFNARYEMLENSIKTK